MKIVQCENNHNHYYDADKFRRCPYCAQSQAEKEGHEQKTAALFFGGVPGSLPHRPAGGDQKTERYFENQTPGNTERTIGIYHIRRVNPPAGWLVCRLGECRGRFYTIYSGINSIGTSRSMDIVLDGEKVCEQRHADITYDDRHADFYLIPKNGSVLLNGEALAAKARLHAGDVIELGRLTLDFIPYCNKTRNWNETDETPQATEAGKKGETDEKE